MSAGVSRGLLSTEAGLSRVIIAPKPAPAAVADRVIALLQREPIGGFHWRERAQWAQRLAKGDPDERGRRLLTDAGKSDARYVAHVSTLAWRGGTDKDGKPWGLALPAEGQWGRVRAAIERIYRELNGGIG